MEDFMNEVKDSKGTEIKVGKRVLVPCVVTKIGGTQSALVHLETEQAYGHENPEVKGALKGRTKTGLWVEPGQIEVTAE
jgi:hypothetical protein